MSMRGIGSESRVWAMSCGGGGERGRGGGERRRGGGGIVVGTIGSQSCVGVATAGIELN